MHGDKKHAEDQGHDPIEQDREKDVQVWARAHGVSADELSGALDKDRPKVPAKPDQADRTDD